MNYCIFIYFYSQFYTCDWKGCDFTCQYFAEKKRKEGKESGDAAEEFRNGVPPPGHRHPSWRSRSGGERVGGGGTAVPECGGHAVVPLRVCLLRPHQVELPSRGSGPLRVVQHPPP